MKQKFKKSLKIVGIISGSIAILVIGAVIAVKFTPVGKYITSDLLSLMGMLLVSLLILALLITFIVMDFRKIKTRKRNSFSGIQRAIDVISDTFQNLNK